MIVENHPRLCTDECLRFRDLLETKLEVALGLETIHPDVLPALNKRMTVDDFDRAAEFLREAEIAVRAFILLKPPLVVDEDEAVEWTLRSIDHAFAAGAGCCSVIPTRAGNGVMEQLAEQGAFAPPRLVVARARAGGRIRLVHGRVFVDLWDAEMLAACQACRPAANRTPAADESAPASAAAGRLRLRRPRVIELRTSMWPSSARDSAAA